MRDTREGNGPNPQDFGEPKRRVGAALAWAGALVSRRGLCSLCLVQTSWVGRYVEATPRRLRLNGPASIGKTRDAQDRMVEGAAAAPAPANQKLPEGSQAHRGQCSPNNRATAPSADGGRESPRVARPQPPGIRPRGHSGPRGKSRVTLADPPAADISRPGVRLLISLFRLARNESASDFKMRY